jgi:DNA polymerase-4
MGYAGRTIGVMLRYDVFRIVTRALTIAEPTQQAAAIRQAAGSCLRRIDFGRRFRLLGVRVGGLVPATGATMLREPAADRPAPSLFD